MPKGKRVRYRAVVDPRVPGNWRVKNIITGQLVGLSFESRELADRSATRRNQPWRVGR